MPRLAHEFAIGRWPAFSQYWKMRSRHANSVSSKKMPAKPDVNGGLGKGEEDRATLIPASTNLRARIQFRGLQQRFDVIGSLFHVN
jgi:hypothetical protein